MPKKVSNQDVLNKKFNITNSCYSIFNSKNILKTHSGLLAYVSPSGLEKRISRTNKKYDSISTTTTTMSLLTCKKLRKRRTSPILNVKKTSNQRHDYNFKKTKSENFKNQLIEKEDPGEDLRDIGSDTNDSLLSISNSNLNSSSEKTLKEFECYSENLVQNVLKMKLISCDCSISEHILDEDLKFNQNRSYFIMPNYVLVTKFTVNTTTISINLHSTAFSYQSFKIEKITFKNNSSLESKKSKQKVFEKYKKFINTYNLIKSLYRLGNRKEIMIR
jgi:hypothetical protein